MSTIPTTLDEAVDYLLARMTEQDKKDYAAGAPAPHFGLGMNLRNEWGLWQVTSPLAKWMEANGIHHGDDRSQVIFDALRARLQGKSFDIKARAEWYRRFWEWSKSGRPESWRMTIRKDGSLVYPFEDDCPKHLGDPQP